MQKIVRPSSAKSSQWSQRPGLGLNTPYTFLIMPTYPVINTETGEQKEVKMSFTVWDQWLEDNPGWIRDWSDPSTAPMKQRSVIGGTNLFPEIQAGTRF